MKLIIYRIDQFEFKPQTSQTPSVLSGASRESAEVPILWRWSPCGTGTLYADGAGAGPSVGSTMYRT